MFAIWQPRDVTLPKTCLIVRHMASSKCSLPKTCLVVRHMAASKCYIAKDVSCCSPDGSLKVFHCQIRVLLFVSWQLRSVTLPNTSLVVRQMAASKCDIAKDVSCCSSDGSLELLHCENVYCCSPDGSLEMLHRQRRVLL